MSKTIRQIAEELGVSKQSIQKRLKREPLTTSCRQHMTTKGNVVYIDDIGIKLILSEFLAGKPSKTPTDNLPTTTDNRSPEVVDFFKLQFKEKDKQLKEKDTQIAEKDKQLAEKDKQLADLTAALVSAQQSLLAAQALHAETVKQLTGGEAPADEREAPPPKGGIFGFFRNQRSDKK